MKYFLTLTLMIAVRLVITGQTLQIIGQTLQDKWIECNAQGCKVLDPYYSEGGTVKWEGSCVNGKADGYGKLTKYKNGEYESTYEGEYKNGIREGKGKFTHKDGSIKEGLFVNGQLYGLGTATQDPGYKYEGNFINYRSHGYGKDYYSNGTKFEGFFVSDHHYTGKLTKYDGTIVYIQQGKIVSEINEIKSGYKPELGVSVTEYFDKDFKRCNPKDASFYRLITYESDNKPKGIIKDYYITGELQNEFYAVYLDYDDAGKNFYEGEATWYFKNGQIEEKRYYFNNNWNGRNTRYYENGQKAEERDYYRNILNGEYIQWYKTGKLKLTAKYKNGKLVDDKYIEYDESGDGALVYNENFSKNKDIWQGKADGNESEVTENNQVLFRVLNDKAYTRSTYITLDQSSDFSIEAIIQKNSGKDNVGYGLMFGWKDWDNYYQFFINGNGAFGVWGKLEGINLTIKDWTSSTDINKLSGRNQLKVFKFRDEFVFSINGQVVDREKVLDMRGNYYGIEGSTGEYLLESLTVKEFLSADQLQKRTTINESNSQEEWKGNGSGFFISEKGYIATNYHVVQNAQDIQVEYWQSGKKQVFRATVVVSDKQNDLAILKIEDPKFKTLSTIPYVFNTTIQDVGTEIFALGYPIADVMGEEVKFTDGKISSKTGIQGDITVYQISVPIQPGNSGGPLFDNKGNLVGITSYALNKGYFNTENVNYAIKATYLKNLVDVLSDKITLPNNLQIYNRPLTEKVKEFSEYVPIIKVR